MVEELLGERAGEPAVDLQVRLWDPSTQLRYRAKRARAAAPGRRCRIKCRSARAGHDDERDRSSAWQRLEQLGLARRLRMISGPQGPRVLLDGRPVLLLCSNNYLGLADHPRVREAAADAAMRWGVGAGASRLVSGTMTIHRRLEERLAAFEGSEAVPAVRLGLPRQHRRDRRAGRRRRHDLLRRAQPRLDHRRLPARRAREVVVYRHRDLEHLEWSLRRSDGARRAR